MVIILLTPVSFKTVANEMYSAFYNYTFYLCRHNFNNVQKRNSDVILTGEMMKPSKISNRE